MTPEKLAKMIDQTLLKQYCTLDDLRKHCEVAGGIRDAKTALAMIEAGASRIGTSAGVAIVDEFKAMHEED